VICFKQAGRIPHQKIMNSLKLMARHVLPHFNPHRTDSSEPLSLAAAGGKRLIATRAMLPVAACI
jgi:hypothetical protein